MSDDQIMDEAQKTFATEKGKPFALVYWWKTLKNEPKWCAHLEQMEKEKNKEDSSSDVIDVQNTQRPIGRDAAKAERSGKRKTQEVLDGVVLLGEKVDIVVKAHAESKQERQKAIEVQQRVSSEQLETARLKQIAARDKKQTKLLDVYNSLLSQDTSRMTEQEKANREKAMEKFLKMLGNDD
uniref:Uncharacterized protein n=1 Tax=Arundo donax TaxID=35708 RepID=A0A0A9FWT4_ARUDO